MISFFDPLRQCTLLSVALRLVLAMICSGMLGIERAKKGRAAGFRTYMLVSMAAALTMLLSQYDSAMLAGPWSAVAKEVGAHTDVSRFGARVISGIGFLGAGTILVTGRQEVKGLTTAAGLWSAACTGLAVGAGFYECVLVAFPLIVLSIRFLPVLEGAIIERARNMNIYVGFHSLDDVSAIIEQIKAQDAQIYEVDILRDKGDYGERPSAVFSIRLPSDCVHSQMLTAIAELENVTIIDEV